MNPLGRHPSSTYPPPERDGEYEIADYPGDRWRRVPYRDGAFRLGLQVERWWRWREVTND